MTFDVRSATAHDIPNMQRLRGRVRENRLSDPQRITAECYRKFFEDGSIWVAESNVLLGFAALDRAAGSVWALFVDPEAEGLGVGRALHDRLLGWAAEQGLTCLRLGTEKGTRAWRFYQRAGWSEVGKLPNGEAVFEILLRPVDSA